MRFLMVLIWAFLISLAITYVVTSMAGAPFSMMFVYILTIVISLGIFVLGELILKEKEKN